MRRLILISVFLFVCLAFDFFSLALFHSYLELSLLAFLFFDERILLTNGLQFLHLCDILDGFNCLFVVPVEF